MAEEKGDQLEEAAEEAASPKRSPQLLLLLANVVLTLAAVGTLVYTKILYQRPSIEEATEVKKKKDELKTPPSVSERPLLTFDPVTVNIATTSGKSHYATLAMSLECRDDETAAKVRAKKVQLIDEMIRRISKRQVTELSTIQGKFILKSELLRAFNEIMEDQNAIVDIYFPNFLLQ